MSMVTSSLDHLRALVFSDPNPASSPHLAALLHAESQVAKSIAGGDALPRGDVLRGVDPLRGANLDSILWETAATAQPAAGRSDIPARGDLQVTARLRMAQVPSSVVHLLEAGEQPLVTLTVQNHRTEPARVRLRAVVEGYSAHAIDTVVVAAGGSSDIHLLPTFFPERLAAIREICRATLHLCIDDLDGKTEQERTVPIWLLPRSSALLYVADPATGQRRDLTRYLGAYVTPNAPGVLDLLRRAASQIPGGAVASYQVDAQGVQAQVAAVYNTLRDVGLTYVNSVLYAGVVPGVLGQRIRLPRESLEQRSANCIDGVVLLASVLEAASLNPAVVLVPGHALLAWETGEGSNEWDYLETTLLGSAGFDSAWESGRSLAEKYEALGRSKAQAFRRLSLRALRDQRIWPME